MSTPENFSPDDAQAENQDTGELTLHKDTLQDLDAPAGELDPKGGLVIGIAQTQFCRPNYPTTGCVSVAALCRPSEGPTCAY